MSWQSYSPANVSYSSGKGNITLRIKPNRATVGPEGEAWNHRELFSGFESEGNFSGWISNLLGTSDSFIPSNFYISEWQCLCFSYSLIVEVENFQFYRSINGEEFFLGMSHISECYHVLYKRCTDEIWGFLSWWYLHWTSPGGSDGKESAFSVGDPGLIPGSGRCTDPGNCNLLPILAGEFHGQRSLAGYSPGGHKEQDTTEQLFSWDFRLRVDL